VKITYMLKREDFYAINERTLKTIYKYAKDTKRLYVYPELNAIVTARPSRAVREYLYTEFRVSGSAIRRLLVRVYAGVLLNSGGLFASKRLDIKTDADRDTLIYPCNKKYRIFDFATQQVRVAAKDGFPRKGLANEISFRTENRIAFVPEIIDWDENGYSEHIIDGSPVARMGERTQTLCERAFEMWSAHIVPQTEHIPAHQWAGTLENQIQGMLEQIGEAGKIVDESAVKITVDGMTDMLRQSEQNIPVSLSHGDLQSGNIWTENGTGKLYIIDWESCTRRSVWYDKAVLFEGLRRDDGLREYAKSRDLIHATVLLEDIVFRLEDLCNLPLDYGCREFDRYIKVLQGGYRNV